jgi:hypothetical protein
MGRARDLTMGTRRRGEVPGHTGGYAELRRMLAARHNPDPAALYALLSRLQADPARKRYAEGELLLDGWERYRELSGTDVGPKRGSF